MVRILAFQASGPGSIPGWRKRAYDVTVSMGVLWAPRRGSIPRMPILEGWCPELGKGSVPCIRILCMVRAAGSSPVRPRKARLAQSVERTPFKRVVVGSSPTSGAGQRWTPLSPQWKWRYQKSLYTVKTTVAIFDYGGSS